MTKPMSGADYRAHAQAIRNQQPTEVVTLKSGSVFELRRMDLQAHVLTGSVPQTLLNEGMAAWKKNGIIDASQVKKDDEQLTADALIFMREVVHECTVKPKFVEFATSDDEISARDMLKEDFTEIFQWAMSYQGVTGLEGLKSFRKGRTRGAARSGTNRKKQRRKSKRSPELVGSIR